MKKTTTTILATILGLTTLFPLASCSKDPIANDENTIAKPRLAICQYCPRLLFCHTKYFLI